MTWPAHKLENHLLGANIHARDRYKNSAIVWASLYGHNDIVKTLISKGANPNDVDHVGKVIHAKYHKKYVYARAHETSSLA